MGHAFDMGTDRELLELAAKAIGAELHFATGGGHAPSPWLRMQGRDFYWNPLADDGDALRLAVRLDIEVGQHRHVREASAGYFTAEIDWQQIVRQPWGDDKDAATRRAIVMAAAEIGRSMAAAAQATKGGA